MELIRRLVLTEEGEGVDLAGKSEWRGMLACFVPPQTTEPKEQNDAAHRIMKHNHLYSNLGIPDKGDEGKD